MHDPNDTTAQNLRREERLPLDGEVTITIDAQDIVGPGRNVSSQGVYFTTTAALRVHVRVPGRTEPVEGELIRVESMGDGRLGIAVRFSQEQKSDVR
ncbi:MAG: PilZ domain-containing protein [Planctomycetota bacterium]